MSSSPARTGSLGARERAAAREAERSARGTAYRLVRRTLGRR